MVNDQRTADVIDASSVLVQEDEVDHGSAVVQKGVADADAEIVQQQWMWDRGVASQNSNELVSEGSSDHADENNGIHSAASLPKTGADLSLLK